MKKYLFNIIRFFIPLAAAITVMSGLVYLVVQQDLRQTANDEPVQIAQDFKTQLAGGSPLGSFSPSVQSDIENSLAPFVIIYDGQGKPVTGSGLLNGVVPALPSGVFDNAKQSGEDRFTWEPKPGLREAVVVQYYTSTTASSSGYVAVGHSLQETERHESQLGWEVLFGWLAALIVSFIAIVLVEIIAGSIRESKDE